MNRINWLGIVGGTGLAALTMALFIPVAWNFQRKPVPPPVPQAQLCVESASGAVDSIAMYHSVATWEDSLPNPPRPESIDIRTGKPLKNGRPE